MGRLSKLLKCFSENQLCGTGSANVKCIKYFWCNIKKIKSKMINSGIFIFFNDAQFVLNRD